MRYKLNENKDLVKIEEGNLFIAGNYKDRWELYIDDKLVKKFSDDIALLKYIKPITKTGNFKKLIIVDTSSKYGKTVEWDKKKKMLVLVK